MKKELVEILLATYNGERYLSEQIESICNQTYTNWKIIVRDDGSTDSTKDILKKYKLLLMNKFEILDWSNKHGNIGVVENFQYLIYKSKADYIMFCDQDDIWVPEKIEESIKTLKKYENFISPQIPLLFFSDLIIVDDNIRTLSSSMWATQKLNPNFSQKIKKLATCNVITGCTVLINKFARDLFKLNLTNKIIHDWWIALAVLKNNGKIIIEPKPLVKYRQHDKNVIGVKKINIKSVFRYLFSVRKKIIDYYHAYKQSRELNIFNNLFEFSIYKVLTTINRLVYDKGKKSI
jgi:glycosyltransferase involved in cell wall biosynthesis